MFTGIITDIGSIESYAIDGDHHAKISTSYDLSTVDLGASIACEGICLTVVETHIGLGRDNWFSVDISAETVNVTTIPESGWPMAKRINLERALKVGDELGGHIVSGHVDGVATIVEIKPEGDSMRFIFDVDKTLSRFVAPKGSVALNGTSLTVNAVDGSHFGVNIIPHTQDMTTWGQAKIGDPVNVEIDMLARYVARLSESK